jgi:hypothetical protein
MKGLITEISLEIARPFIEKWHYSHRVPTGKNIFFGWFVQSDQYEPSNLFGETLYAVSDYGIGVNPYQSKFLATGTGQPITDNNLIELKRQCRIEPKANGLPLTYFMAQCHKLLARMGYRYVVTFSDPNHGHNGGVYRAGNFQSIGKTNGEWHTIDEEGEVRHRRYAYRHARRNGISIPEARERLGLKRIETLPKDRWILQIAKVKTLDSASAT